MPRAMAERGMLPQWFGRTNHAGSPTGALVLSSGLATLTLLLTVDPSLQGMFEFLLLLTTSIALWFYIATIVTVAVLHIGNSLALPISLTKSYPIYKGVQDALVHIGEVSNSSARKPSGVCASPTMTGCSVSVGKGRC